VLNAEVQERFWAKVAKSDGCWEWTGSRARRGYGKVRIGGVLHSSHRLSYEWSVGPIPDGMHVLHHCDNPPCVRPDHLWIGTRTDNQGDMVAKGRQFSPFRGQTQIGELNRAAKITEDDVRAIRKLVADGVKQSVVAKLYGLSRPHIHYIVRRKSWAHVL